LARISIGLSTSFPKINPAEQTEGETSNLSSIPISKCALDLTIAIDWHFVASHDPSSDTPSPSKEIKVFFECMSRQVHGFYYSGPASAVISSSSSSTGSVADLQAMESLLVGSASSLSLSIVHFTSPQDLAISRAAWHIDEDDHGGVPLKTTELCHNNKHYPLISLGTPTIAAVPSSSSQKPPVSVPTYFHLVTNIDRNALFPRYKLLDKLFTHTLTQLSGMFTPSKSAQTVDWAPLFLAGIDKRKSDNSIKVFC